MAAKGDSSLEVIFTEDELQLQAIYLVGIWLEALLYGAYFFLFINALGVLTRRDALKPLPSKVFFAGILSMFVFITVHNALNMYRLILAFAYQPGGKASLIYLNSMSNWSTHWLLVSFTPILWIGDALVIYRCFLVWQRCYWVIVLPTLLFLGSVATHSVNIWWMGQQSSALQVTVKLFPVMNAVFPLYLAQNTLTTGLIVYKIWLQHRQTKAAGIVSLNTPTLLSVIRIVIESAGIYTLAILLVAVLRALDHPGRFVVQYINAPLAGIAFVLMAIRAQSLQDEARNIPKSASLMPDWLVIDFDKPSYSSNARS
ncbi:hypothetical protein BKA70DRAFT_1210358 [Coprinopsis sp. MPI-PUGE-AT-0042]|nr:hypothetical protein BKA70DRAFT_1210358 [Coprinopsis sp. MPI-PUGE-AT-0042]